MRHSNTYFAFTQINDLEYSELYAAVKALGGRYDWYDEENNEKCTPPIIAYNPEHPIDVTIKSVYIGNDNSLYFDAEDVEFLHEYKQCNLDDVEFGHIGFITDYLPETESIGDVSDVAEQERLGRHLFECKPISNS